VKPLVSKENHEEIQISMVEDLIKN